MRRRYSKRPGICTPETPNRSCAISSQPRELCTCPVLVSLVAPLWTHPESRGRDWLLRRPPQARGSSLYPSLAQRVTHREVLRILVSIGPTETMHFQTWSDKAGNAPPLTDPTNGLVFPDLNSPPFGGED